MYNTKMDMLQRALRKFLTKSNIGLIYDTQVCPVDLAVDPCGLLPLVWQQVHSVSKGLPQDLVSCIDKSFAVVSCGKSIAGLELIEIDGDKPFVFCQVAALSLCMEVIKYNHDHRIDLAYNSEALSAIDLISLSFLDGVTMDMLYAPLDNNNNMAMELKENGLHSENPERIPVGERPAGLAIEQPGVPG